jgi:hypothetical protein
MPMKELAEKTRIYRTLLKGQALSYFEHHLMRRLEAENSDVHDNELIEIVLRNIILEYISKSAIHLQSIICCKEGVYIWVLIHPYNNL